MIYYLIICRSLTYAQRTAKALEKAGITAIVTRSPQEMSQTGCSYSVKVRENRLKDALVVLQEGGLSYKRIYVLYSDGTGKEVAL